MKKEKIIELIDECEELIIKCLEDENYATGLLVNLGKKAEKGDIESSLKAVIIVALMEEEPK